MKKPKISRAFRLRPETAWDLSQASERSGISQTELVERALAHYPLRFVGTEAVSLPPGMAYDRDPRTRTVYGDGSGRIEEMERLGSSRTFDVSETTKVRANADRCTS